MKTLHYSIIAILSIVIFSSSSIALAQHVPFTLTQSPLQQFRMGTFAQGVHCNTGLQLFFKAEDYTPVCAQSGTATVLLKRGWATTHPPEPFVNKIAINGLQQNYTIGQPINATVTYSGYYWYTEPDVKILDANGTQIWFNCAYCYARSEPVPRPLLDAFTYIVRDYVSNKLPVINKTETYTMIASLENKTASAEFTIVKPLMSNRIAGLENDTGIVTFGNRTYYFETPNYTKTASGQPARVLFHDVIFTLFPSSFGGIPLGGCEGMHYLTDAKFSDGTSELLHVFVGSSSCGYDYTPIKLSTHTNPQAGLTFYNGKMKLLVSTKNTFESSTRLNHVVDVVSIQFVPTPPNPGGPTMQLTLMNIGMKPITNLNATLGLNNNYIFNFKDITQSNPLAPGHSTSDTEILIGAGSIEMTHPLTVAGTANNETFSYTLDVHIPSTNQTIQNTQIIPSCASKISHQYAVAGPPGILLCPVMNFHASGNVLNATGFYGIYNYTEFPNTQNFVLEPGHNGTFTYEISTGSIYSWTNIPPANEINITNNLSFMHDAGMNNHPGVIVSVFPNSEIMLKNSSALVMIKFSASKDALPGTYWVTLPPGICAGGEMIILTITNCEK